MEKYVGVWGSVVGGVGKCVGVCGEVLEEVRKSVWRCEERCGKLCWGGGWVRDRAEGGVGKCVGVWKVREEVCWGSQCLPPHFPTTPFTSPTT